MWSDPEKDNVVKLLAVVCELTQTDWSKPARAACLQQLAGYPVQQVLLALKRCENECRFKLTLADIVQRLDDRRPGAEEAWANFPKTEDKAGVVTDEMSVAWGVAAKVYDSDPIAARMAFKETYEREVREARAKGSPTVWRVSPGWNKASTEAAVVEALQKQLMSDQAALQYVLPEHHERVLKAAGRQLPPALTNGKAPGPDAPERLRALTKGIGK